MWDSECRFVGGFAGSQSGKTSFGPHWLDREIHWADEKLTQLEREEDGVGDFLAVSSSYKLFSRKMLPEMIEVFCNILKIGKYWALLGCIELSEDLVPGGRFWAKTQADKMYGRILLGSAEAGSGLESGTYKAIWLDEMGQEEYTTQTWDSIGARVTTTEGRILGTTSLYVLNWLKFEWYDRWEKGHPDYDVIQFDSTDNPKFSEKEFLAKKETMAPWKFSMRYRGRYDQPAGLVYDNFDMGRDVMDAIPEGVKVLWYVGHDFGLKNPAQLAIGYDPKNDDLYVAKEWKPTNKPVYKQAEALKAWAGITTDKPEGDRIIMRRSGGSHQEEDSRDNWTQYGWRVDEPVINDVAEQISRVYGQIALGRLKVLRSCTGFLDEILRYSHVVAEDGITVLDDIKDKSRFHYMDAMRYVLCGFRADREPKKRQSQVRSGSW
jgi:hypothetical protein